MEKAIEIKRRAQRCIQNGDLDGALNEYEKLVDSEESDPYHFVLLADLLYKKGDHAQASERYLAAVGAYEKAALYKNAIAVCKKMTRLSLSPAKVLKSLAVLHALDGLSGEAALYYVQYAEHMVRSNAPAEAAHALRQAFDVCQDNIKVLEQLSEAWLLAGDPAEAARALLEAASHYRARSEETDAQRCLGRAAQLDGDAATTLDELPPPSAAKPVAAVPGHASRGTAPPEPGSLDLMANASVGDTTSTPVTENATAVMEGLDSGRHHDDGSSADTKPSSAEFDRPFKSGGHGGARPPALFGELPIAEAASPDEDAQESDEPDKAGHESGGDVSIEALEDSSSQDADADTHVYEIREDEYVVPLLLPEAQEPAAAEEHAYVIRDEPAPEPALDSGSAPGLAFGADVESELAPPGLAGENASLVRVESLLIVAQEQFRAGERDFASRTLAEAAQAYESLGRLDSAATIYRSLGRGAQATPAVMELWLSNCERRGAADEAAQVACELGDRALNDGNEPAARTWFQKAISLDAINDTARRRLQRLDGGTASAFTGSPAVATGTAEPSATGEDAGVEMGRVEVAVGRAEAVTFDLNGLLAEFQRGVEAQLAGDPQSHYDLGMTYREMGLLEQAVDSFRVAQGDERLAGRALEMIGRCHASQGRWPEAVGAFRRALAQPGMGPGEDVAMRFHLGGALVELGEPEQALAEYENVARQSPGFEDVDARLAALRRVMGGA